MWLRVQGRNATGQAALDIGIDAIEIVQTSQGVFAITNSRAFGGLVSYALGADGLSLQDSVLFHSGINRTAAPAVVINQLDGFLQAGVVLSTTHMIGYRIFEDGSFGNRRWTEVDALEAMFTDPVAQTALAELGDGQVVPATGAAGWQTGTLSYAVHQGGVLALGRYEPVVYSYTSTSWGGLVPAVEFGPEDGLWIHAPTAMEVFSAYGQTWAVVSASGTHSLTVLQLGPDGGLMVTDHVMDTGNTRFANVQAVTVAQAGDRVLVVAGGSDFGITLFTLLPDGRLVWMQSLEDTPLTGLDSISALQSVVIGDQLLILAGSSKDAGITSFNLPLSQLGAVVAGSGAQAETVSGTPQDDILIAARSGDHLQGGAGHDILVAGLGVTVMTGGSGADTFVMHPHQTLAQITDFARGTDRLDLSAWPMLRDPAQLQFMQTANGATLSYRDAQVQITAHDGQPLTLWDIFPGGRFATPDRMASLDHMSGVSDGGGQPPDPPPAFAITNRSGDGLGGLRLLVRDADTGAQLHELETDAQGSFTLPPPAAPALLAVDHTPPPHAGPVTAADATDILRMAIGLEPAFANDSPLRMGDLVAADVNGDGRITIRDALDALRISMGLRAQPDTIFLAEDFANAPADATQPLPATQPDLPYGTGLVAIWRGDMDDSALWSL
ncbi:M10 family metallopeptidase C-terminal domain-containing protein [Roseinatronobacter sp.]|uniref:M10 family metallopeptidase C-terminal domain-containing protein n=1 Tax=Roseinatronobacter sp. TaxID=1945755 RepID=UPI003F704867